MKSFKEFQESYYQTPKLKQNLKLSPMKTHEPSCSYNYGHDCDCKMTQTHHPDCEYNMGHDCNCGLKESIELEEAFAPKEEYNPKVGDDVRIPLEQLGKTAAGKVSRIGRTMVHVKTPDGESHALNPKHVFKHDMSCKNYHEYSWNTK